MIKDIQEKIIQIMPAENWWCSYKHENETISYSKIFCFALVSFKKYGEEEWTEIIAMDMDMHGIMEKVTESTNFHEIFYSTENMLEKNQ